MGVVHRSGSGNHAHHKINDLDLSKAPSSHTGTEQRPLGEEMADTVVGPLEPEPRAVQIKNSLLRFRSFWFATT